MNESITVRAAMIEAIALLDVAISGTAFTKPNAGRLTIQKERAERVLENLRSALTAPKVDHGELVREARKLADNPYLGRRHAALITRLADALGGQDRSPLPPTPAFDAALQEHLREMVDVVIPAIDADLREAAEMARRLRFPALASQPQGTPPAEEVRVVGDLEGTDLPQVVSPGWLAPALTATDRARFLGEPGSSLGGSAVSAPISTYAEAEERMTGGGEDRPGKIDYGAQVLADLKTAVSRIDADYPNYASWPLELPAGHWREMVSALAAPRPAERARVNGLALLDELLGAPDFWGMTPALIAKLQTVTLTLGSTLPRTAADDGLEGAAAARTADVPPGWKLVPTEPTPNIVAAWWRQKNTGSQEPGVVGPDTSDYAAYRAMIAAAHSPADAREGGE